MATLVKLPSCHEQIEQDNPAQISALHAQTETQISQNPVAFIRRVRPAELPKMAHFAHFAPCPTQRASGATSLPASRSRKSNTPIFSASGAHPWIHLCPLDLNLVHFFVRRKTSTSFQFPYIPDSKVHG